MKILLVSGFLGAGKTTFIKEMAKNINLEFVVLENEYADIGVDKDFLNEKNLDVWEMSEGCICCSMKGDFKSSIKRIYSEINPEYLLIEPTGLGMLSSIIENIKELNNKDLIEDLRLLAIESSYITGEILERTRNICPPNSKEPREFTSWSISLRKESWQYKGRNNKVSPEIDFRGLTFDSVKSVKPGKTQSVYDITVEDTHNFIADGLVVHNTAWNLEDLLHEQVKNPRADVRKRYKAILPNGESLWPERWPIEKLQELKEETGSIAFSKSYLNEAISSEDAVFKSSWIDEAKKKGRDRKLLYNLEGQDQQKMTIAMGVDLAISQKETGDYTAFAVVGEMEDGTKIPLYLAQEKLTFAQTQEMIKDLYQRFNPALIKVESNAYQAALVRDMQDNTSLPIKGYSTGGEKFDPDVGLQSIAVEMENGKWILPYSQESHSTMKIVDTLTDGMLRFPSGHTEDILMALWFANTGLRELSFNQEPRKVWW